MKRLIFVSLKNKNQLCFGKISFRNVTMKRRLLSCTWHFWRGLKWVFETKLREFSIILETFFQKSNTWITFENLIFLMFFFEKRKFFNIILVERKVEENWWFPLKIWFWNDDMIDFFKIFLWKVFDFDHDFSTFWETTSLRDF